MEYLLKSCSWEPQDEVTSTYPTITAAYSPDETTDLDKVKHEYNGVTGVFIEVSIKTEDEHTDADDHEKVDEIKTEEEISDENKYEGMIDTKTEDECAKVKGKVKSTPTNIKSPKKPKEIF